MSEASPVDLDLKGKSREDLLTLKLSLENDIRSIRIQIVRAQKDARNSGRYADSAWWLKVNQALRIKGWQCQRIQLRLGQLRQEALKSVEGHFMEVARERLDLDTFKTFLETARRRAL